MSVGLSIIIMCEIIATLLICWGWMHEEKFIAIEDKIIADIKMRVRGAWKK